MPSNHAEIEKRPNRNVALRRARNLLLPRLVSGELDVPELDIAVE